LRRDKHLKLLAPKTEKIVYLSAVRDMSAMLRIIVLLPLLVFFISPDRGMSQTSEGGQAIEVWPEFTVNYDPSKKVRLMFAIRNERNEDTPDKTVETTATVIYRLRPLVRNMLFADDEADNEKKYALSLAANWEYSRSFGKTLRNENRLMFDATPRYRIYGNILVENRLRLEFRFRDDGQRDYWFRDRVRAEKKFKIHNFRFAPFAYVEPMWTWQANAWNRNLLSAGTQIALVRNRARLDISYLRKNCDTCDFADANAIGVNLQLFFGKK